MVRKGSGVRVPKRALSIACSCGVLGHASWDRALDVGSMEAFWKPPPMRSHRRNPEAVRVLVVARRADLPRAPSLQRGGLRRERVCLGLEGHPLPVWRRARMPVVKPGVRRQPPPDHRCPWTYPSGFKVTPKRAGREPLRASKSVSSAGGILWVNVTAGWAAPAGWSPVERSSAAGARTAPWRCTGGGSPGPRRMLLCQADGGWDAVGVLE